MIRLSQKLRSENLQTKILLQIHDELLIEAPREEVEFAANLVRLEMEKAMLLDVPLQVDVKIGNSWE